MYFVKVVCVVISLTFAFAQTNNNVSLAPIVEALDQSETDIKTNIYPLVLGILATVVVISIAGGVIKVISSKT